MHKHYPLIFLTTSLVLFSGCNQTQKIEPKTYEWDKYGIKFDYSGFEYSDPNMPKDWYVHEYSEDLLIIAPTKSSPVGIDMDFIYTRIRMNLNTDLASQIQTLKDTDRYSLVEIVGSQVYSDYDFTIVNLHSSNSNTNNTNFYLTEVNGSILQYEAGILEQELINNILSSIKITDPTP